MRLPHARGVSASARVFSASFRDVIAGAITVLSRSEAVIRYLGLMQKKPLAYSVASSLPSYLAVCFLYCAFPIFKGKTTRRCGARPAIAFLYSGPAINILAIVLLVEGLRIKLVSCTYVGAIVFSVVIGISWAFISGQDDKKRTADARMFAKLRAAATYPHADARVQGEHDRYTRVANWADSRVGSTPGMRSYR
jgi:uncharacterized membrane protein YraQ (UPF0718 family)